MSRHQAERLYTAVCEWRDRNKPLGAESIWQCDRFATESLELAKICMDIVGYSELDDDE